MFGFFPPKIVPFVTMSKNMVESERTQMTIRRTESDSIRLPLLGTEKNLPLLRKRRNQGTQKQRSFFWAD